MSELEINTVGTTGSGDRLMVLIHGYGADQYDLAPLAPHVDPDGRFFTVCPRGPVDVFGAGAGWYERDPDGNIEPAVFLASVDAVDRVVDAVCDDKGFDRSRAVVIGFSQGGAMTLASTLRRGGATRPAAAACLSGMMQQVDGLDYDLGTASGSEAPDGVAVDGATAPPRLLVHHGSLDPVVPVDRGRRITETLTAHGVDHVYREYPMQHEISMASLIDLRDWLAEV